MTVTSLVAVGGNMLLWIASGNALALSFIYDDITVYWYDNRHVFWFHLVYLVCVHTYRNRGHCVREKTSELETMLFIESVYA